MGGNSREGKLCHNKSKGFQTNQHLHFPGGKAKPLKAPKKDKKEMDEDEIAFREKQKAGTCFQSPLGYPQLIPASRRKGEQRDGGEGQGKGTTECWTTGHQEVWEEVNPRGAMKLGALV